VGLKLAAALDGDEGADRFAAMLVTDDGATDKAEEHTQYDSCNHYDFRAIPHDVLPVCVAGRYVLFSMALSPSGRDGRDSF
jgi:hypothetical protein